MATPRRWNAAWSAASRVNMRRVGALFTISLFIFHFIPSTIAAPLPGTGYAWGSNNYGQLGDSTTTNRSAAVNIAGLNNVIAVAAGGDPFSLALLSDGTVRAWGNNAFGQLGDGTTSNRTLPVAVNGLTNAIAIAAGGDHSMALLSDGTVRAWGYNGLGQLGDGSTIDRATPVQVNGLTNVIAIAVGSAHSLALLSNGTVRVWGSNVQGLLGDGTTTNRTTPIPVNGLTNVVAIAGGSFHSMALLNDGTIRAWGVNGSGQLGDGTTTNRITPVQVGGLTNVVAVAASSFSMALLSDGTVRTWGGNTQGQLGDGTVTLAGCQCKTSPVTVSGLTNVRSITAGDKYGLAVLNDHTIRAWGRNAEGQLGDGTTTGRLTPVSVLNLTEARS